MSYGTTTTARPGYSRPEFDRFDQFNGYSPAMSVDSQRVYDVRTNEKKELQELNDKLASYIEKVRFLEAQNRKLEEDLKTLTAWNPESDMASLKLIYEGEIKEVDRLFETTGAGLSDAKNQLLRHEDEYQKLKKYYEELCDKMDNEGLRQLMLDVAEAEYKVNHIQMDMTDHENRIDDARKIVARLQRELGAARGDLESEKRARIDFETQVKALTQKKEFDDEVHQRKLRELRLHAVRDTTDENREYFRNELYAALKQIRADFDSTTASDKSDMESWYKLKIQEIQTDFVKSHMEAEYEREEIKRLREQITGWRTDVATLESKNTSIRSKIQDLDSQLDDETATYAADTANLREQQTNANDECTLLVTQLQQVIDDKSTVQKEINEYRELLEGKGRQFNLEEVIARVERNHNEGGHVILGGGDHDYKPHNQQQREQTPAGRKDILRGEDQSDRTTVKSTKITENVITQQSSTTSQSATSTGTKTAFNRFVKGNVGITECSLDGKFIVLENTNRNTDENMDGWSLKRHLQDGTDISFNLPADFVLKPLRTVKIWSKSSGGINNPPEHIVADVATWGISDRIQTFLYNRSGDEQAVYTQYTVNK